jgi:ubiquinone/menaquinone biosynthesis C-methylase UbiE
MSGQSWHFYDETERRTWQNPEEILESIGLRAGQTLIDIGCGQGFFSLPAARLAGPQGQVYALDASSQSIDLLRQRAAAAGLDNLTLIVQEAEEAVVCEGCADLVFLGIVLHDFRDPAKVLRNARRMLRPGGRLANLDWKKEAMPLGPPLAKRFDIAFASSLLRQAGFTDLHSRECGPYHYLISAGG